MRFFSGLLALVMALAISGVAAFFSVSGLAALFAAAWLPVVVMGGCLEAGKLVAAGWLHANWHNPKVGLLHKAYLCLAVAALMMITAIGIYGYLSAGYLEQTAPLGEVTIQIESREAQIVAAREKVTRLTAHQAQLDAAVDSLISQQHVVASQKLRTSQKAEREQVASDLTASNATIERLAAEIVPLKSRSSEVGAKLGPVKYVAALFGWQNPDSAVRLVILVLMFAFDPLAVTLVLSAAVSFSGWVEQRRARAPTPDERDQTPQADGPRRQTPQPKTGRYVGHKLRPDQLALLRLGMNAQRTPWGWTTATTTVTTLPATASPEPVAAPPAPVDQPDGDAAWAAFIAAQTSAPAPAETPRDMNEPERAAMLQATAALDAETKAALEQPKTPPPSGSRSTGWLE